MSEVFTITIDGVEIEAKAGQTIIQAADEAGVYIPRLCHRPELHAFGSCRVCTVKANGRSQAACTTPANGGMIIENDTDEMKSLRGNLIEMLFVEGNHYCMFCEKSGNCELQGMAYRFGIAAPKYPYLFPDKPVDASHPDVMIDHNRCILCARCVRASKDLDGKNVFQFVERSGHKRVAVNAEANLKDTDLAVTDKAAELCPVGAILKKRVGFKTPYGQRMYDEKPIGSDIESDRAGK